MNKQTLIILSVLASATSVLQAAPSFAVVRPGWERPIYKAELTVIDNEGSLPGVFDEILNSANIKTVELVMTQQDGSKSPTGFVLLIDGQNNQAYQIQSVTKDSCNSTTYALVPLQTQANFTLQNVGESIHLIDNSKRTCMDFHKFHWDLEVKSLDFTRAILGQVQLAGNPEGVITAQ